MRVRTPGSLCVNSTKSSLETHSRLTLIHKKIVKMPVINLLRQAQLLNNEP